MGKKKDKPLTAEQLRAKDDATFEAHRAMCTDPGFCPICDSSYVTAAQHRIELEDKDN